MMGYYMGDPGFFSVLKTIGGTLAGGIPGIGGIASKIIAKIPTGVRTMGSKAASAAGGAIVKHPVISAAGAAGALALGSAEAGRMSVGGRRGYHPSKRHLHALAMGLRRAKPRMNVTNVHALRRSLRRAHGFAKLAMKVIHITHPKKKGHFAGFKKARSKK
jgi:hypothetical protein